MICNALMKKFLPDFLSKITQNMVCSPLDSRACLKTHRASLFHKFWLVFWQNFLQYARYSCKILPKSRSKFMENRDTLGFKTGSNNHLNNRYRLFISSFLDLLFAQMSYGQRLVFGD